MEEERCTLASVSFLLSTLSFNSLRCVPFQLVSNDEYCFPLLALKDRLDHPYRIWVRSEMSVVQLLHLRTGRNESYLLFDARVLNAAGETSSTSTS